MKQVREQDGREAGVEERVEFLVFAEEQGCGEDAVERLEVEREVHRVGAEMLQQADVEAVGEYGAHQGEEQQPQPIEAFPREQRFPSDQRKATADEREQQQGRGEGSCHFPGHHRQRVAAAGDQLAVQHREDRGEEGADQGDPKT